MIRFGKLLFAAGVLGFAFLGAPAFADTPKDTVVIAKQIDDIITLDPAEVFEFSGGEVIANIYDRIMTYEAEDTEKLVGGVAESYSASDDGHIDHAQDPSRAEIPFRQSADRRGRGVLDSARDHPQQDTGLHLLAARLDARECEGPGQGHRRVDRRAQRSPRTSRRPSC